MRTLLAISPHLDDALFSAGASLWVAAQRGWRVVIATIFTGNVARPTGFALACQLDKGLPPDVDYMALRREEDRQACSEIGAETVHLPLLEAPHRGYDSAPALFAHIVDEDGARQTVPDAIAGLLADIRPDLLLAPMGIGGHVDHLIVRDAVRQTSKGIRTYWWEDWPYVDKGASPDRSSARRHVLPTKAKAAKARACACYRSQLGFQFGGVEMLTARLASSEAEWFHADR